MKAFLAKQSTAGSLEELQAQIDRFVGSYNDVRPHRPRGRITTQGGLRVPGQGSAVRPRILVGKETRVRHDRGDRDGRRSGGRVRFESPAGTDQDL
jgi:hypothetical protein